MATELLGRVKSPSGHSYEVKWDPVGKKVYVGHWSCGKAESAGEAMRKAEAHVYDK